MKEDVTNAHYSSGHTMRYKGASVWEKFSAGKRMEHFASKRKGHEVGKRKQLGLITRMMTNEPDKKNEKGGGKSSFHS